MAELYSTSLLKNKSLEQVGVDPCALSYIMAQSSVENTIAQFNRMYLGIDYENYPVTSESAARSFVQVLLTGAQLAPAVEVHNAHGRSDLEVDAGKRHWVFEFKFLPKETADQHAGAERLVEQAVQQIEKRQYGKAAENGRKLVRVGLVFSEQERQIVCWRLAD